MDNLPTLLAKAKPGDTIKLPPGPCPVDDLNGLLFDPAVTITSADPANPAILTNFNIGGWKVCAGLRFTHLDLKVLIPNTSGFNVYGSDRITFDHCHVYGPPGAPDQTVQAFNFFDCTNVSVTNSEIEQVSHGLSVSRSDHVTVTGNNIHNVNSDTLDFVQVTNAVITGNALHDFYPTDGNHPDAMQFGTVNSTKPSSSVMISDNLIYRGAGQNAQGIWISDDLGTMPFQDFTVSNNLIIGTGASGLRPLHLAGGSVTGNELLTVGSGDVTNLLLQYSDGVTVSGNSAVALSALAKDGNTNITTPAGLPNVTNVPVSQAVADARVAAWFAGHAGAWSGAAPVVVPPVDPSVKYVTALKAVITLGTAANAKRAGPTKADMTTILAAAKAALA